MAIKKVVFNYTGSNESFTVPPGVSSIFIQLWGAAGGSQAGFGNSGGGPGGYSEGILAVTPGEVLTIIVGQGGTTYQAGAIAKNATFGGGGGGGPTVLDSFYGCSAGGRSAVRLATNTEAITAGGGGGSAGSCAQGTTYGGPGGGLSGLDAYHSMTCYAPKLGLGGTQTGGGAGGVGYATYNNALAGSQFTGGTGGGGSQVGANAGSGGGGGGGYWGGGGGAGEAASGSGCPPAVASQDVSGGGGSGYIGGVTSGTTVASLITATTPPKTNDPNYIAGVGVSTRTGSSKGGNGLVVLTYTDPLSLTKIVDKNYAAAGNILTYTVAIGINSTASLNNIIFIDTIPTGTSFVSNSLTINGVGTIANPNPPGINLGNFNAIGYVTIAFNVLVDSIPSLSNTVANSAISNFDGNTIPFISNIVLTTISTAIVSSSKLCKTYADIGDVLTYTIPLRNTGNTTAFNVIIIDTIPNGTTFVDGSFTINTTTILGSPNPPGIIIGTVPVGTTTISFKVTVNTIPTINPIQNSATTTFNYTIDPSTPNTGFGNVNSNSVYTQINHSELAFIKSVDKSYATCSDTLKYTFKITNTGNVCATNIVFKDTIPNGTQYISNTFILDGVTITGADPTIGVNLNTISAGATSTITFQVKVLC